MTRAIGHRVQDVQETIVSHLRAGATFAQACEAAGVSRKSGYKWLARGEGRGAAYSFHDEELPEKYVAFAQAVRQALANVEVQVVQHWMDEIPGNWQAERNFLARRFPERWGKSERLRVEMDAAYPRVEIDLVWDEPPRLVDETEMNLSEEKTDPSTGR